MAASAWQTQLSSFKERNLYAYDNSLFCDVDLSVMDANGDKVIIPAHKYVLAISSPVFEAMFYGELAETGPTIDLQDCTKEGLQEMLRYVYSDEVNLSESNVLEVLYLAEKYMLPFLKEKCEEYLEKELKPEDVFHVLPAIRNRMVEEKCWDMVDSDTERTVSSESFLNISKEMLCKVLEKDTLCVDEVVLFEAVEKWALNKLNEEGLKGSIENKRAVLGERVIKLIRFPLMSEKKFAEKVLPSGILTMDQVTELIQFFNDVCPLKADSFSAADRGQSKFILPRIRFNSVMEPEPEDESDCFDFDHQWHAIAFKVNKPLFLAGTILFGAQGATYDVTMTLYKSDQQITQISSTVPTEDKVIIECFEDEEEVEVAYYGFAMHLDDIVPLDPNVVYRIEASILGPLPYVGFFGQSTIVSEGIVITYLNSEESLSGSSVEEGQFPTLLFIRH